MQRTARRPFRCMYSCSKCSTQLPMCNDDGEINYFRCVVCDAIVCAECVGITKDDKEDASCVCKECVKNGY
jgi:hypothetical protein